MGAGDATCGADYLTASEAARLWGVKPETVVRMIERGRLPAFKLGRKYRILRAHLELLMGSGRGDAAAAPGSAASIAAKLDQIELLSRAVRAELAASQLGRAAG